MEAGQCSKAYSGRYNSNGYDAIPDSVGEKMMYQNTALFTFIGERPYLWRASS
jgi:hypothetical protein